ncbi:SDR family oxidoreductase [Lactobacillus panisapium]|uniref:SDR family oxidoreductase n=1 Tax=Lactobacillus panisapium TaxID=2012495 RepID=UPI000CDA6A01|nr:SDR family oxidoreductase [Lactobacillus panisapium]
MEKQVMLIVGAGQISLAIARRLGADYQIIVGDKNLEHAQKFEQTLTEAGFNAKASEMDLASRDSIKETIKFATTFGEIKALVNGAGLSPSQAKTEDILKVDLYGTAVLLEEVGKVIAKGGVGITISSQSGHRLHALTTEQDRQLATTPTSKLLQLPILQPENIADTLQAYQLAKRCNEKRVMAEAINWAKRGARLNAIAPGIIVTPLALDEFNGIRGDFYRKMFAQSPAGRPGTADEVANVAELLMTQQGAFITGSTFLIDGGATANYFYGQQADK